MVLFITGRLNDPVGNLDYFNSSVKRVNRAGALLEWSPTLGCLCKLAVESGSDILQISHYCYIKNNTFGMEKNGMTVW